MGIFKKKPQPEQPLDEDTRYFREVARDVQQFVSEYDERLNSILAYRRWMRSAGYTEEQIDQEAPLP